jgi:hypothetical protein
MQDQCRFAIESHVYPALTQHLTGTQAGHYTQAEVKELVQYHLHNIRYFRTVG